MLLSERSPASTEGGGLGEREAEDVGEGRRRRSSSNRRCAARAARLDLCSWEGTSLALLRDDVNGSGEGGLERQRRRLLGAAAAAASWSGGFDGRCAASEKTRGGWSVSIPPRPDVYWGVSWTVTLLKPARRMALKCFRVF